MDHNIIDPFDNNYISQFDSVPSSTETEDSEYDLPSNESPISWTLQKGKHVQLSESDNPWYIHKKCAVNIEPEFKSEQPKIIHSNPIQKEDQLVDFNLVACVLIIVIMFLLAIRIYANNKT